jgi:hypothetical protein
MCNLLQKKLQNGDKIIITWLPNPRNHPYTKNCYIGSEGIVEDLNKEGFTLRMENGARLIVGKKYSFKRM